MTVMDPGSEWYKAAEEFAKFCKTVAALRDPQSGCPWDLEQNHKTLRRFMIEEAYEAAEAMSGEDRNELRGELGDVLLQVVLNSQIAKQEGAFAIEEVIRNINEKMRRRHPHVFAAEKVADIAAVRSNWERIKEGEKGRSGKEAALTGVFSEVGHRISPLLRAFEIGKIAGKIDFDWANPKEVLRQLRSEIDELEAAIDAGGVKSAEVRDELADTFFTLVQLCRQLEHDPESVALDGCMKFEKRFEVVEELARKKQIDVRSVGGQVLNDLWQDAKKP